MLSDPAACKCIGLEQSRGGALRHMRSQGTKLKFRLKSSSRFSNGAGLRPPHKAAWGAPCSRRGPRRRGWCLPRRRSRSGRGPPLSWNRQPLPRRIHGCPYKYHAAYNY